MTENDDRAAQHAAAVKQLEVWTATAESQPSLRRRPKRAWWEIDFTRPWPDVFASESDAMARLAEAAAQVAPLGEARMPAIAFANHLRRVCRGRTQGGEVFGESGLEPYRWRPTDEEVDELLALSRRFEDFLHAYNGEKQPRATLDVVHDPSCIAIREILKSGARTAPEIAKDARCPCSRKTVDVMLDAMEERSMVKQTRHRGPWHWLSDKPTK